MFFFLKAGEEGFPNNSSTKISDDDPGVIRICEPLLTGPSNLSVQHNMTGQETPNSVTSAPVNLQKTFQQNSTSQMYFNLMTQKFIYLFIY